jgi:hypothetical protein
MIGQSERGGPRRPTPTQSVRRSSVLAVAAVLTSLLGVLILVLATELTYFAVSNPPTSRFSDAAHDGFHIVEEGGFSVMGAALLLFMAWRSVWNGELWGFWALLIAGLPAAALPPLAYQEFGPWHVYVWFPAVVWLLSLATYAAGLLLQREKPHQE